MLSEIIGKNISSLGFRNNLKFLVLCSSCQKKREDNIRKELADSISDLDFYDYLKTIAKFKKEEEEK